jgi:hypothetical protein
MEGIEIGKTYTIRRPNQSSAVFSLQYNFKPPINESRGGLAVVKEADEQGYSSETWEVRLPAVELSGARKATLEDSNPSLKGPNYNDAMKRMPANKGKKRVIDESDEDEEKDEGGGGAREGSAGEAKREEVFHGASAPSKYEFLLTWDTETLPEARELVLEKVSSLVRLQHKVTERPASFGSDLVKSGIEANKKLKTLGKPVKR